MSDYYAYLISKHLKYVSNKNKSITRTNQKQEQIKNTNKSETRTGSRLHNLLEAIPNKPFHNSSKLQILEETETNMRHGGMF